jgi:hypothetical protein
MRCPFCHDSIRPREGSECARCRAWQHPGCWRESRGCAACRGPEPSRAAAGRASPWVPAFGSVALAGWAFLLWCVDWFFHAFHAGTSILTVGVEITLFLAGAGSVGLAVAAVVLVARGAAPVQRARRRAPIIVRP